MNLLQNSQGFLERFWRISIRFPIDFKILPSFLQLVVYLICCFNLLQAVIRSVILILFCSSWCESTWVYASLCESARVCASLRESVRVCVSLCESVRFYLSTCLLHQSSRSRTKRISMGLDVMGSNQTMWINYLIYTTEILWIMRCDTWHFVMCAVMWRTLTLCNM